MELFPLLKHESKNMALAIVVGLFILYFCDILAVSEEYNQNIVAYFLYTSTAYYIDFDVFSQIFTMNIVFMLVLTFLQFYGNKKDFMSALPFTRHELLMSKRIVGLSIILIKNIIFLLYCLYTFRFKSILSSDMLFCNPDLTLYNELSSVGNIILLCIICFTSEIALYSFMSMFFAISKGIKTGITHIVLIFSIIFILEAFCYKFNIFENITLFYISNMAEMCGLITIISLISYAILTALTYRYYLNRKIEITNYIFPYKFSRILFISEVALCIFLWVGYGIAANWNNALALLIAAILAGISVIITRLIGKPQIRRCEK